MKRKALPYRLTKAADFDLDGIWRYTCQEWNVRQATSYLRKLKRRVEWLAKNPLKGKPRADISVGLRSYHEGRHLIFYRIGGEGTQLVVIRVLHDRMDVSGRLAETEA